MLNHKKTTFTVNGDRNPARVAATWLQGVMPPGSVDSGSFEEVDRVVGSIEVEGHEKAGCIVSGISDLAFLCRIGRFQIVIEENGTIHARTP